MMMTVAMDQMNPPSVLMLNVGKDGLVVQHLIGVYIYIYAFHSSSEIPII